MDLVLFFKKKPHTIQDKPPIKKNNQQTNKNKSIEANLKRANKAQI